METTILIKGMIVSRDKDLKTVKVFIKKEKPIITIGEIRTIENNIKTFFRTIMFNEESTLYYDIENKCFIFTYRE